MELWQLRTFSAVAKNLHFTRASEDLNLSQPAVSHQIKSLEDELGEQLFLRNKEGISLTKAGRTMYEHAAKILDIADEIIQEVKEIQDKAAGDVIFSTITMFLENPFPLLFENFKKKYQSINLMFQNTLTSKGILDKVESEEIDIGLSAMKASNKEIVEIPYGSFKVVPVCGANHPLAGKKKVSLSELENEEWALVEPKVKTREYIDKKFVEVGYSPKKIFETNDGTFILGLLNLGETISLLPMWGIAEKVRKGELSIIDIKDLEIDVQTYLSWKAQRKHESLKVFIKFLFEHQITGVKLEETCKI